MTIETIMKSLNVSREEAIEIMKTDKEIDRGADPFPLTAEQKKVAKTMTQADRKPTVYKFSKRERKPDAHKRHLISIIESGLHYDDLITDIIITNLEREIEFKFADKKYRLTLSAPRK